ncbi:hypothetical protein D3C76_1552850 [compost metagenome]
MLILINIMSGVRASFRSDMDHFFLVVAVFFNIDCRNFEVYSYAGRTATTVVEVLTSDLASFSMAQE